MGQSGGSPITLSEHRVERRAAELRQTCDLGLGHAGVEGFLHELGEAGARFLCLLAGLVALGAYAGEFAAELWHRSIVKHLTS